MKNIYMAMNIYIHGTFEKESQWGGARFPADIYTPYIHIYVYIYIYQILTDAKFNVESDGYGLFGLTRPSSYIYLRKTSKVNVPVPRPCILSLRGKIR